jgi:hypothetical protein
MKKKIYNSISIIIVLFFMIIVVCQMSAYGRDHTNLSNSFYKSATEQLFLGPDSTIWTGLAGDSNWFTASNWTNGVPDTSLVAVFSIHTPDTVLVVISNGFAFAKEIYIDSTNTGILELSIEDDVDTTTALFVNKITSGGSGKGGFAPFWFRYHRYGWIYPWCYYYYYYPYYWWCSTYYWYYFYQYYWCYRCCWWGYWWWWDWWWWYNPYFRWYWYYPHYAWTPCGGKNSNDIKYSIPFSNEGTAQADTTYVVQYEFITPQSEGVKSSNYKHTILREWDEPSGLWVDVNPTGTNSTDTIKMYPMKGYVYTYCTYNIADSNTSFMGRGHMIHDTVTRHLTNSGGSYAGWNLIGNPYTNRIDWDSVPLPPQMDATAYFWDLKQQNYVAYTQNIGGSASRYIAAGLAFFVKVSANIDFSFKPPSIFELPAPITKKKTRENVYDTKKLLVLRAWANNKRDEVWLNFNKDAKQGFENQCDAYKLVSSSKIAPQISVTYENISFSLNTMPFVDNIPINFSCQTAGDYKINLQKNTTDKAYIILEDKKENKFINLSTITEYLFSYQPNEMESRFVLHLKDYPFGMDPLSANSSKYIFESEGSKIKITSLESGAIGNIIIYDLLGKRIAEKALCNGINVIDLNSFTGYCIVTINDKNSTIHQKLLVK